MKDVLMTFKTQQELFPEDSHEKDLENTPSRHWRIKKEDLRGIWNHRRLSRRNPLGRSMVKIGLTKRMKKILNKRAIIY